MAVKIVNNMVCYVKIDIIESAEELKEILSRQTDIKLKQKVQALYWLKIGAVNTIENISILLGCHRTTVSRWFSTYRKLGIEGLLKKKKILGRPRKISPMLEKKLRDELKDTESFKSYNEVQTWLKAMWDINLPYSTVHRYVYYNLNTKLKRSPPISSQQNSTAAKDSK
ncbi:MAG: helix-turn-helix domain-containing protein [Trichodesmium sp. St16_bin4-tuft]|nr:helix-turn-helix domain-containing protein [Trichodesmium sp. St16_bin4-tuft]